MTPDAETRRLRLHSGNEVEAFVRLHADATRPRVLLLHGNPGSSRDWERLIPHLTAEASIAALDLPGFGRSRRATKTEPLSLTWLAQQALSALDVLGWRAPVHLVGHSHGGGVAQVLAAEHPQRVAGIVLIGTLGTPAHGSYRLLALPGARVVAGLLGWMLSVPALASVNQWVLARVLRSIYAPEAVPADKLAQDLELLTAHPAIVSNMVHAAAGEPCEVLRGTAARIRCPAVFLHGEADALVPPRCARAVHDRILAAGGNSEFHSVVRAGHMLIQHRAAELAEHVLRALPRAAR